MSHIPILSAGYADMSTNPHTILSFALEFVTAYLNCASLQCHTQLLVFLIVLLPFEHECVFA